MNIGVLDPNNLPTLVFVTPDLCTDMHDCPVATGDAFIAGFVPPILDGATTGAVTQPW